MYDKLNNSHRNLNDFLLLENFYEKKIGSAWVALTSFSEITQNNPNNLLVLNTPDAKSKKIKKPKKTGKRRIRNKFVQRKVNKKLTPFYELMIYAGLKDQNQKLSSGLNLSIQNSWLLGKYAAALIDTWVGLYAEWTFVNLNKISKNEDFNLVCRAVYNMRILGPFYYDYRPLFKSWFSKLTFLKDPSGLTNLVTAVLMKTHLKKHRIVFFRVNRILRVWYAYLSVRYGIKGYSLFFKGKLGKKGSVKKTKFFRKYGITSLTNKSVRVNHKEYWITTLTGTIGAGMSVFFKLYVYTNNIIYIVLYTDSYTDIIFLSGAQTNKKFNTNELY